VAVNPELVNSTTCSNSFIPGGFVHSSMREPSRGGPSVSGSTRVWCVCQAARFAGSVT